MLTSKVIKLLARMLLNERGEAGFMGDGGEGSGDGGASSEDVQSSGAGGSSGDPGVSSESKINYPDGFDESLKGNRSLEKFADEKGNLNLSNLAKSYVHMEGLLGKDKVTLPDEHFTDEQWDQFFDKIGRPDRDAYKIENNLPDGLEENKKFLDDFTDLAHKSGLLPKQAQTMLDFFNSVASEGINASKEQSEQSFREAQESLKKEWGDGYEGNIRIANHALSQFASEEEVNYLKESGFIDDPKIAKLFNKIGKSISEDKFIDNIERNRGQTPQEVQETINSYYKHDHPYMNRHHPQHEFYSNKMLELQEMLIKNS